MSTRVRAKSAGFSGGFRRRAGEVFEVPGKEVPAYCEKVSKDTPLGRDTAKRSKGDQFVKRGGEYVNVDQRSSADAFKSLDPVDPSSDPVDGAQADAEPASKDDGDDGSDLT